VWAHDARTEIGRVLFSSHGEPALALLEKGTTNMSERHHQKHVTVKPVLLRLIYRKTGIILRFWCILVLVFRQRRPQKGTCLFLEGRAGVGLPKPNLRGHRNQSAWFVGV
jgi:hypothetical protein